MKQSLKKEIMNMNLSQLNDLMDFIRDVKVMNAKTSLNIGDKVYVVQKTKKTPGVILDIKIKNAVVEMEGRRYRVPMTMLEAA